MTPFTIHCTTCHASLRVTSAAAIGQILACPKCGSMVQVTGPAPGGEMSVVAGAPVVAGTIPNSSALRSAAVFASDIEQLAAEAASLLPGGNKNKSVAVPKAIPVVARAAAATAAAIATAPTVVSASAPTVVTASPPVVTGSPPPLPNVASPPTTVAEPPADLTVRSQEAVQAPSGGGWWIGVTAAVATAVSLAAVAWGTWAYFQPPQVDEDRTVAQAGGQAVAAVGHDEVQNQANDSHASSTPNETGEERGEVARPSSVEGATNSEAPPAPTASETVRVDAPGDDPPQENERRAEAAAMLADGAPTPALAEGDHTVAKPTLELSEMPNSEAGKVAAEAAALALPDLPAIIGNDAAEQGPLVNREAPAVAGEDAVDDAAAADPAAAESALKRVALAKIDAGALLGQRLPAMAVEKLPLDRFLALVSEWSNVPIAIDLDGLRSRGIALDAPVTISKRAVTFGQAIEAALAPHRLALALQDGYAIVRPADAGSTRKARYVVSDLARPGDPEIRVLAEMVRKLLRLPIDAEKGSDRLEVMTDTLYLTATDETHDRMIELCEKLRVARGRPLRTRFDPARPDARFDPRRFELATRGSRAKATLARPVTAGIGTAAPLSQVLKYLSDRTGAVLLVDAAALADTDLSVHTECRLQADEEPLSVALERLLAPIGLTYRVIDERTIEITTPTAAAERAEIEFYAVRGLGAGDDGGTLVKRLQGKLTDAEGEESVEVVFDAPSRTLIVAGSSPMQAKVEVLVGAIQAVEAAASERGIGAVR